MELRAYNKDDWEEPVFLQLVQDGREDVLLVAVNKYGEHCHRGKLLRINQQGVSFIGDVDPGLGFELTTTGDRLRAVPLEE